ncbi:hypothetical protein [Micromonospora aurantiaca (nom. illeg.)]|uniref:hypothetical protein n=1 Tax=Micromonospora aurantiaca (nom. illeg.) TaxID=47850 RepID=UPI00379CCE60
MRTLPTPCARDGKGPGHQYGLPDLVEPTGTRHGLLPTPTAVAYGSNMSPSAGAARRPSLAGVATRLLPTPTVADSRSSANATAGRTAPTGHAGRTLTDAARLLPTPRASDTGTPGRRAGAGFRPPLSQVLLPTPRATDGAKGCPGQRGSHGDLTLPSAVRVPARTLPTPRASDARGPGQHGDGGADLRTAVAGLGQPDTDRWGVYAAAVARWELLLGRPVPEPTQPGRHGKPVLAPPFVEWLMGPDTGHVTDPALGLPRTAALRVLGNGVVPQQAAAALRLLLCPHRWQVPSS